MRGLKGQRVAMMAVVVGAGAAMIGCGGSDPSAALRQELVTEFDGAYPAAPAGGGETVDVELVAAESKIELVEGTDTAVWAYNETVPGPALRVSLGDTLRVNVTNDLDEGTTIHWHGVRVPNDMDGVPDVNQPRIEPGETFVYEFTPPDAGTYWYHSHTDGSQQLERGLYGSIVVEDPDQQPLYAQDVVWMVDDWLLEESNQLNAEFNTSADLSNNGRWGNVVTVNASTAEELVVSPGERFRLRLINASNGRVYTPDFGELDPTVIAIDGLTVGRNPEASELNLAPGNRIDLDITAPDTPGTYPVLSAYEGIEKALGSIVVEDAGAASDPDPSDPPNNASVPGWDTALDMPVDHELVLETHAEGDSWVWTINGAAFPDHEALELTAGEFTKIRLTNMTHPLHPMHLHGQFFKVLTRNGEPVDEPYFRDTVLLENNDVVDIGLVPLDVGEWVLHCHIQSHGEAGMMTVMNVKPQSPS